MAQPYDLTGFAALETAVPTMVADQAAGRVKFAGGSETWLANPAGAFLATLAVGGSPVATTTNIVRTALTLLRSTFDLIAAAPGAVAENAIVNTGAAIPLPPLEAGKPGAIGPVSGIGTPQNTSYDLSGIAALQTTANAMMADQQAGVTNFSAGTFLAVLTNGGPSTAVTIAGVRDRLARLRRSFDSLAQ